MGQFGQELRQQRMERGVSIDQICAVTKVSARHLEALEADRFEDLPGGVFRKGIVRSYAAAVGMDEAVWIERFERSLEERGAADAGTADWVEFAENIKKNRSTPESATGVRWFGVVLMLVTLLVCGWLTWKFVLHDRLLSNTARTETQRTISIP